MKLEQLSGHTKLFGIIADPIYHVKTPQVVNTVLHQRNVDGVLVPLHIKADDLATAIQGLKQLHNLEGFVVTVPHKSDVVQYCDRLTLAAEMVEAVNCIRRTPEGEFVGTALDGIGFVNGFLNAGHTLEGKHICLVGAGGAGKAIAFALAEQPIARLTILNRSLGNAQDIEKRIARYFPDLPVSVGTPNDVSGDVVINSTPLGMRATDPLPVPQERLNPDMVVAEIIMDPSETPLMKTAASVGCTIHPGLPMLESQAFLMAEHMGAFT